MNRKSFFATLLAALFAPRLARLPKPIAYGVARNGPAPLAGGFHPIHIVNGLNAGSTVRVGRIVHSDTWLDVANS